MAIIEPFSFENASRHHHLETWVGKEVVGHFRGKFMVFGSAFYKNSIHEICF